LLIYDVLYLIVFLRNYKKKFISSNMKYIYIYIYTNYIKINNIAKIIYDKKEVIMLILI